MLNYSKQTKKMLQKNLTKMINIQRKEKSNLN